MPYRSPSQKAVTPQGRGRYRGFDVLDSGRHSGTTSPPASSWPASRSLVSCAFFSPHEVGIAAPLLDLLLAQDREPRVPVLQLIDSRLAAGETDGWHYDDLPEDAQAWRDTLAASSTRTHCSSSTAAGLRAPDQRRTSRPDPEAPRPRGRRQAVARLVSHPRVEPMDAVRVHRVLLPPLGLERDRLPRPGLPPRLPQPRRQRPRPVGSRRHRH